MRENSRFLLIGREDANRPDPVQAAWLYAQMARWRQTSMSREALRTAMAVFRADLHDAALGQGGQAERVQSGPIGAFAGPSFDPDDVSGYLASFTVPRRAS